MNEKSIKADRCANHRIKKVKNSFGKTMSAPQKTLILHH